MHIEHMRAVIEALREGGYEQCQGCLADGVDERSYCAMGVACLTYGQRDGEMQISDALCDWLGVPMGNIGDYRTQQPGTVAEIVYWNDVPGKDFAEIADILEARLNAQIAASRPPGAEIAELLIDQPIVTNGEIEHAY